VWLPKASNCTDCSRLGPVRGLHCPAQHCRRNQTGKSKNELLEVKYFQTDGDPHSLYLSRPNPVTHQTFIKYKTDEGRRGTFFFWFLNLNIFLIRANQIFSFLCVHQNIGKSPNLFAMNLIFLSIMVIFKMKDK
jgi:hypothetical protein